MMATLSRCGNMLTYMNVGVKNSADESFDCNGKFAVLSDVLSMKSHAPSGRSLFMS